MHLRQSHKKRKKRYGSYSSRGQIKDRISIDERPSIVDLKKRTNDWEIDTIIGKNNKAAIRVLKELGNDLATTDQKAVLAKYVEWGDLPQAFPRPDKSITTDWESEVKGENLASEPENQHPG